MNPFFWLVILILLSPFIVSIASIIIWRKHKNPNLTIQRRLFKYRRGCGVLLIIFALFSFFKSYDSNAEAERYYTWIILLVLMLIVGYLLFRNYAPSKKK
jgi:cytochrome bd-type quinol oxidase subunit 2